MTRLLLNAEPGKLRSVGSQSVSERIRNGSETSTTFTYRISDLNLYKQLNWEGRRRAIRTFIHFLSGYCALNFDSSMPAYRSTKKGHDVSSTAYDKDPTQRLFDIINMICCKHEHSGSLTLGSSIARTIIGFL